jgi:hypothetical protein
MESVLGHAELVFFDPDNGLEVKSCPPGGPTPASTFTSMSSNGSAAAENLSWTISIFSEYATRITWASDATRSPIG